MTLAILVKTVETVYLSYTMTFTNFINFALLMYNDYVQN